MYVYVMWIYACMDVYIVYVCMDVSVYVSMYDEYECKLVKVCMNVCNYEL